MQKVKSQYLCTICPLATQTRLSFNKSFIQTSEAFQLEHINIWGSLRFISRSKCTMFIILVDDFIRYTCIFLIKHKSNFLTYFKNFFAYVKTQFGKQIKIVRTDNAKELSQGETLEFYKKRGIFYQSSCVHTPQQNGMVERKHRHLIEVSRALFFQSNAPFSFWGDSVESVVHTINKMPVSILNNLSPFEKLHKRHHLMTCSRHLDVYAMALL